MLCTSFGDKEKQIDSQWLFFKSCSLTEGTNKLIASGKPFPDWCNIFVKSEAYPKRKRLKGHPLE
jgi:hypothetical protein